MCEQGPECQKIFKSSVSHATPTDMNDHFNKSSHALDLTLDVTL